MSYAKNSPVTPASINGFLGITDTAAPSAAAATNSAGYLWGIGFGDRGYGQPTPAITAQSSGTAVSQLTNFAQVLSNLATWQNTSTALMPSSSQFASGSPIVAFPSSQTPSLVDFLQAVDTNRLNYNPANMTLVSSAATTTRATPWGSGSGSITCTFDVSFASENAARYFFNTGGQIRFALSHPDTSNPQNTAWRNILLNSNFAFAANQSLRLAGSHGTGSSVGYYGLTTSYQTIISSSGEFSSPYTSNSFVIEARAVSIAGVNGAKGSSLQFRITLTDSFTSAFTDSVASGTNVTLGHFRAGAGLPSLPAAPSCSVLTAL